MIGQNGCHAAVKGRPGHSGSYRQLTYDIALVFFPLVAEHVAGVSPEVDRNPYFLPL